MSRNPGFCLQFWRKCEEYVIIFKDITVRWKKKIFFLFLFVPAVGVESKNVLRFIFVHFDTNSLDQPKGTFC